MGREPRRQGGGLCGRARRTGRLRSFLSASFTMASFFNGNLRRTAWRIAALVLCVVAWHLATRERINLGVVTFQNVPPPGEVAESAWSLLQSPLVLQHLGASLRRVFMLPPLEVLRPIPAVAWIPLAILMFPSSEASMVFITFVGALFPVLLNTVHGVEAVDARLVASARSLGAGRLAVFREVILPGALPSVVTGLAIGMGTAWFCLVTAEMISGQFGIGYYTWMSYTIQNYADIVVGMLFIGVLGMGSSALVRRAGQALMPWRAVQEKRK
ncbi:MAG: ABC transporter permease [Burkholderiales bacterium]|nr:ABC transporter permease [Burkholderiales bacterium]